MFFSHYVFSKDFFKFWIACSMYVFIPLYSHFAHHLIIMFCNV